MFEPFETVSYLLLCPVPLQAYRPTFASGCCSAEQATTASRGLELQTTAAPLSATPTTATIMASARTIQANFQSVGKKEVTGTPVHDRFLSI